MGYSGLNHVYDSDMAAGAFHTCQQAFIKAFNKDLKDKGNTYNTDGIVNGCLIIEAGALDKFDPYNIEESLDWPRLLKGITEKIKETDKEFIENWGDEDNRIFHRTAYKRMKKNLEKFLAKHEIDLNDKGIVEKLNKK